MKKVWDVIEKSFIWLTSWIIWTIAVFLFWNCGFLAGVVASIPWRTAAISGAIIYIGFIWLTTDQ